MTALVHQEILPPPSIAVPGRQTAKPDSTISRVPTYLPTLLHTNTHVFTPTPRFPSHPYPHTHAHTSTHRHRETHPEKNGVPQLKSQPTPRGPRRQLCTVSRTCHHRRRIPRCTLLATTVLLSQTWGHVQRIRRPHLYWVKPCCGAWREARSVPGCSTALMGT